MQSITSILLTVAGIAVMSLFGFVALSLFMIFAGILSVTLLARAMMLKPKQAPVYAETGSSHRVTRVWNDGKGTIIDM
jgi:hypothetical protein